MRGILILHAIVTRVRPGTSKGITDLLLPLFRDLFGPDLSKKKPKLEWPATGTRGLLTPPAHNPRLDRHRSTGFIAKEAHKRATPKTW